MADLRTDLEDVKLDLSAGFIDASVAIQARPKPWTGKWTAVPIVLAVAAASGGDLRPVVDSLLTEMRDVLPSGRSGGGYAGPVPGPADCAGGHSA